MGLVVGGRVGDGSVVTPVIVTGLTLVICSPAFFCRAAR